MAKNAGTSQGKVARIEAGSENITLRTLKKLVVALGGRFQVSISPAEVSFPRMLPWWDCIRHGLTASHAFQIRDVRVGDDGKQAGVLGIWTAPLDQLKSGAGTQLRISESGMIGDLHVGRPETLFVAALND